MRNGQERMLLKIKATEIMLRSESVGYRTIFRFTASFGCSCNWNAGSCFCGLLKYFTSWMSSMIQWQSWESSRFYTVFLHVSQLSHSWWCLGASLDPQSLIGSHHNFCTQYVPRQSIVCWTGHLAVRIKTPNVSASDVPSISLQMSSKMNIDHSI